MKKILYALIIFLLMLVDSNLFCQDQTTDTSTKLNDTLLIADTISISDTIKETLTITENTIVNEDEKKTFHQSVKKLFNDGGVVYMTPILLCFILGLSVVIERIIFLTMASTNTSKLLKNIESAINTGGVDAAKEVCKNTSGLFSIIFFKGLQRYEQGIEMVEKSVSAYGNIQARILSRGLSWILLFIAMAILLGLFGTLVHFIQVSDPNSTINDIFPNIIETNTGSILLTSIAGIFTAMILLVFYKYLVAKIDYITNEIKDVSISFMDILIKYNKNKG